MTASYSRDAGSSSGPQRKNKIRIPTQRSYPRRPEHAYIYVWLRLQASARCSDDPGSVFLSSAAVACRMAYLPFWRTVLLFRRICLLNLQGYLILLQVINDFLHPNDGCRRHRTITFKNIRQRFQAT